uniref:Uncharacterized protein n=1 Tax=Stegastes partitus TaxID=144197 RepID=A0A3B5A5Y0_9TELE
MICSAGSFVSAGGQQGMPDPLFTAVGSNSTELLVVVEAARSGRWGGLKVLESPGGSDQGSGRRKKSSRIRNLTSSLCWAAYKRTTAAVRFRSIFY